MTKAQLLASLNAAIESVDKATPAERKEAIGRTTQEHFLHLTSSIKQTFPNLADARLPFINFRDSFLSYRIAAAQCVALIEAQE